MPQSLNALMFAGASSFATCLLEFRAIPPVSRLFPEVTWEGARRDQELEGADGGHEFSAVWAQAPELIGARRQLRPTIPTELHSIAAKHWAWLSSLRLEVGLS